LRHRLRGSAASQVRPDADPTIHPLPWEATRVSDMSRGQCQSGSTRKWALRVSDEPTASHALTEREAPKMVRTRMVTIVLLTVLVGGCVAPTEPNTRRDPWYQAAVEVVQDDNTRALRYCEDALKLKGADLAREIESIRQEFETDKSELNRVRLAMLLSLPGTGLRDDQAALNLLQPFLSDKSYENSTLRPLALVLHAQFSEIKRLDEALQQQTAKGKEEQRRADALQQKLEAILEMEMKMIEREQTVPPPKRR